MTIARRLMPRQYRRARRALRPPVPRVSLWSLLLAGRSRRPRRR